MKTSYERFAKLLDEKGITSYKVHKETGIATATLSDWKNGKSTPKADKMKLIATFLGTTEDYIINGETNTYSSEAAKLDAKISNDVELKDALALYYELSNKKRRHVLELIHLLAED